MEQIYFTQCPIGYGRGSSNGLQIKRRSPGYRVSSDFRHLGLRPFLPGTNTLAPPALRYRRDGTTAEIAWVTPRAQEYETERGLWGRPGGYFAHGLQLDPPELAALANWPAGLHDVSCWRRSDPEPSPGQPPYPIELGPASFRCRPTFGEVAPLAAGLDSGQLASLLTALALATREGRTLFLIGAADRLGDRMAVLTFAFPEAMRAALTFSTYHDRPEELPGFRLQGTVPETRPNVAALTSLGIVADLAWGSTQPEVKPAPWSLILAGWLCRRNPEDEAAWNALDGRARGLGSIEPPQIAWADSRLTEWVGGPLRRAARPTPSLEEPSLDVERFLQECDRQQGAAEARKSEVAPSVPSDGKSNDSPTLAVGIDLGTTYSVVAYIDPQGRPTTIVNASGDLLTPSVVLFDGDEVVVGKEAVAGSAMEPEKVADCVKRDMGGKTYHKPINGEWLPPEVISSLILRKLKADAERKLGPIPKAVITVPAYFNEPRRQATAVAGRLAGLEVLDIINEPTAAALAYGYRLGMLDDRGRLRGDRPLKVMVYDLGGGTFDVTIVEIRPNAFRTIATDGDVYLGGRDWDEKLVELAAENFRRKYREDPRANPQSLQDLYLAAESGKRTLSERSKATIFVNHLGIRHKVEVTREEFEEATAPLLGRTRTTSEIVALQAGLPWSEIDKILLVGGSTRMPMIPRMLEELTGKVPDQSVSADEAVAHGAALYADLLLQRQGRSQGPEKFSITNVNAHSLGLVGVDPETKRRFNQVLIPKNTPLPHSVHRRFETLKPGQRSVRIRVLEGESEIPDACTQVGDCVIRDLPPDLPGGWPVEVSYSYEENGRLRVSGKLVGHDAVVRTEFVRDNTLSDRDLLLWASSLAGQRP